MTVLLSVAIVVTGLFAYSKLPIAALPSYNTPVINVTGALPGASPEIMAASVATPLEKQFSTIAGLAVISSSNIWATALVSPSLNGNAWQQTPGTSAPTPSGCVICCGSQR